MKYQSMVAVLDASAVFAIIRGEPLTINGEELLQQSIVTTHSLAEVANTMVRNNKIASQEIWQLLESLIPNPYPVDTRLAQLATGFAEILDGSYRISLGDKYCLALAELLDKPLYTANHYWQQVGTTLNVTINLIR